MEAVHADKLESVRPATVEEIERYAIPDMAHPDVQDQRVFVCVEDGTVTGHIMMSFCGFKWFVSNLEYWGDDKLGASRLVQRCIMEIRKSGCRMVRVHCTPDAGIQHEFYRKRGFRPTVIFYEGTV